MPPGVVYDGVDVSDVLLESKGKLKQRSKRDILWIYSPTFAWPADLGPSAARMGRWKAHWATGPGLGGCAANACTEVTYPLDHPLLFDVEADPSEVFPLNPEANGGDPRNGTCRLPGQGQGQPTGPGYATNAEILAALAGLNAARKEEVLKFKRPTLVPPPDLPGEGPHKYGVCCDRDPYVAPAPGAKNATCDCSGAPSHT